MTFPLTVGCDVNSLSRIVENQTAPLSPPGSDQRAGADILSGNRGTIAVVIENNTPFRADFVFGTFDNTDEVSTPAFFQFHPQSGVFPPGESAMLDGSSTTGTIALPCARVFSVAGRSLVNLIDANPPPDPSAVAQAGLTEGVRFLDAAAAEDPPPAADQGSAAPVELLIGPDFDCGDSLRVTLDFNDQGPENFRVIVDVTPADNG